MERDRAFNFKLLVPPRVTPGQTSAVRPQDAAQNCSDFHHTQQQGHSKCDDKEQNVPFPAFAATKPAGHDFLKMKIVPPMEKVESNCSPGQLCSKLLDEVQKIKSWKVQVESDTVQKERRLQDNKRTIETQRKAIQELQFGNESLSIKLEEQICENEDLKNKHNATRNLCHLLKDTFQWSAEKMHLFESEREETHHLFMENSESVKKLIAAMERLRIQVEADQQEMQNVKEVLVKCVDLKERYQQECKMKDEEVVMLQTKLQDKINDLQKLQLDLDETQKHCRQLQEDTRKSMEQAAQKDELIRVLEDELDIKCKSVESMKCNVDVAEAQVEELGAELSRKTEEIQSLKTEVEAALAENDLLKKACEAAAKAQEDLEDKSTSTEIKVQELEQQLSAEMKKTEESTFQKEQLRKDIMQHEVKYEELLSNFNELQSEKTAAQQQFETGLSKVKAMEANMKVSEEKAVKLNKEIQRLEEENRRVREEINSIETRIQGNRQQTEALQKKTEESCERLQEEITEKEKHIKTVETKLCSLKKVFEMKFKAQEEHKKEINSLHEENQKLLKELQSKSNLAAELEDEVQKLRAEFVRNKEDTELKCQLKIADMVALMEKHKRQYDQMVEEKDAENKKKEMEAVASAKSLQLDVSKHKTENDELKKQLKTETAEKENLQKELTDLRKERSAVKITQLSQDRNKQSFSSNCEQVKRPETPGKSHVFDFHSNSRKTPSDSKDSGSAAAVKKPHIHKDKKSPESVAGGVGGTSQFKSYRIRTPPLSEKAGEFVRSTIELESDSSECNDLLVLTNVSDIFAPPCKLDIFRKIQSPATRKSPGNYLKLAAMKRMRDAGWTAVTGCDKKKKKKSSEKIFA